MYVGLTRAKDMLFLTWAFRRSVYGASDRSMPSRFLVEIPGKLTTGSPLPRHTTSTSEREGYRRLTTWETYSNVASAPVRSARPVERETRFHSGQRVRHAKFGDGIVIVSKVRGDDEEVDVKFEKERQIKRLSANIANLILLNDN